MLWKVCAIEEFSYFSIFINIGFISYDCYTSGSICVRKKITIVVTKIFDKKRKWTIEFLFIISAIFEYFENRKIISYCHLISFTKWHNIIFNKMFLQLSLQLVCNLTNLMISEIAILLWVSNCLWSYIHLFLFMSIFLSQMNN